MSDQSIKRYLTADDVIARLREYLKEQSVAEFARGHDLSAQYIWMILKGERKPGLDLAAKLGLRRVIVYEEVEKVEVEVVNGETT